MSAPYFIEDLKLSDKDREHWIEVSRSSPGSIAVLPPAVTLGGIDWQPMETAPKGDDTLSVLAWFCGQVVEVSWDADDSRWFGHVGEEYTDSDLDAWAPKPAGPSFGRGVQQ